MRKNYQITLSRKVWRVVFSWNKVRVVCGKFDTFYDSTSLSESSELAFHLLWLQLFGCLLGRYVCLVDGAACILLRTLGLQPTLTKTACAGIDPTIWFMLTALPTVLRYCSHHGLESLSRIETEIEGGTMRHLMTRLKSVRSQCVVGWNLLGKLKRSYWLLRTRNDFDFLHSQIHRMPISNSSPMQDLI